MPTHEVFDLIWQKSVIHDSMVGLVSLVGLVSFKFMDIYPKANHSLESTKEIRETLFLNI